MLRRSRHDILKFCAEVLPCLVVGDENLLRGPERTQAKVAAKLKSLFAASTRRDRAHEAPRQGALCRQNHTTEDPSTAGRILKRLSRIQPPKAAWYKAVGQNPTPVDDALLQHLPMDCSVQPATAFLGGSVEARRGLGEFLHSRLTGYATKRNKPDLDGTSQLSPYLHFGQIGPHTIALAVRDADAPLPDRAAFLEELIVRRELAVNFVRYNANYENFDSCEAWAEVTLRQHSRDKRRFLYTERQLQDAETHDRLLECRAKADGADRLDAWISAHVLGQKDFGMESLTPSGL